MAPFIVLTDNLVTVNELNDAFVADKFTVEIELDDIFTSEGATYTELVNNNPVTVNVTNDAFVADKLTVDNWPDTDKVFNETLFSIVYPVTDKLDTFKTDVFIVSIDAFVADKFVKITQEALNTLTFKKDTFKYPIDAFVADKLTVDIYPKDEIFKTVTVFNVKVVKLVTVNELNVDVSDVNKLNDAFVADKFTVEIELDDILMADIFVK